MMWVDLNNIEALNGVHKQLGTTGFKALKFKQSDYLKGLPNTDNNPIVERAHAQLAALGVTEKFSHVYMLGQLRCLGIYFSPVNFYFFGHDDNQFS